MSAAAAIRRRRAAAVRCQPLDDGRRDPLDRAAVAEGGPSTFGLDRAELRREVARCAAAGWQLWELRARFAVEGVSARG